jgi:hypothetical protein
MRYYREHPDEAPEAPRVFSTEQLRQIERMEKEAEPCEYCGNPIDDCTCDDTTQWMERITGDLNNDR